MPGKSVEEYFGASPDRALIDRAARIVALVQGRETATRTDYAHPRLREIISLIEGAGEAKKAL